jgi:Flp pilus assembly protein TadB
MQPEPTAPPPAPAPAPAPTATWNKPLAWITGILAAIAILATSIMSLGIAVIFWGPALLVLCIAMWGVWSARRRRQIYEHRGPDEMRDPTHAERPWPTKGVIDDRLEQN